MLPIRLSALAGLLALVTACQSPEAQLVSGPTTAASSFDRDFVTNAYQIILLDRAEGEMARTEAMNPEVRQIAAQLVRQADEFERRLAPIATSLGIRPPTTLDYDRRLRLGHMRLQRGLDFDATYLVDQITSHQDAINSQDMMAGQTGGNPQLVALSQEGNALVRTNLGKLRDLQRRLMLRQR